MKHWGRAEFSFLPMMGASRKMSDRRLFTGSYGESSKKSLPVRKINRFYGQIDRERFVLSPLLFCLSSFTPHIGLHVTWVIWVSQYPGWHTATRLIRQVGQLCCATGSRLADNGLDAVQGLKAPPPPTRYDQHFKMAVPALRGFTPHYFQGK